MTQHESDATELPGNTDGQPEQGKPLACSAAPQPRDPLHGVKLEQMVTALAEAYGWPGLAERIPVRCFSHDPSIGSSLKFLRKTPWARDKVEGLYLFMLREKRRNVSAQGQPAYKRPP